MKRAFTLLEMLVVIGIISVLVAASVAGFSRMRRAAEQARGRELVMQIKTALENVYDKKGSWPLMIRRKGALRSENGESIVDAELVYYLSQQGLLTASYRQTSGVTKNGMTAGQASGVDRFGILSPWGMDVMKRLGKDASLNSPVNSKSTIRDHLLRFAIDDDGDGIIRGVSVGGKVISARAHVMVWCAGQDGIMEPYQTSSHADDIYSWTPGQTRGL